MSEVKLSQELSLEKDKGNNEKYNKINPVLEDIIKTEWKIDSEILNDENVIKAINLFFEDLVKEKEDREKIKNYLLPIFVNKSDTIRTKTEVIKTARSLIQENVIKAFELYKSTEVSKYIRDSLYMLAVLDIDYSSYNPENINKLADLFIRIHHSELISPNVIYPISYSIFSLYNTIEDYIDYLMKESSDSYEFENSVNKNKDLSEIGKTKKVSLVDSLIDLFYTSDLDSLQEVSEVIEKISYSREFNSLFPEAEPFYSRIHFLEKTINLIKKYSIFKNKFKISSILSSVLNDFEIKTDNPLYIFGKIHNGKQIVNIYMIKFKYIENFLDDFLSSNVFNTIEFYKDSPYLNDVLDIMKTTTSLHPPLVNRVLKTLNKYHNIVHSNNLNLKDNFDFFYLFKRAKNKEYLSQLVDTLNKDLVYKTLAEISFRKDFSKKEKNYDDLIKIDLINEMFNVVYKAYVKPLKLKY